MKNKFLLGALFIILMNNANAVSGGGKETTQNIIEDSEMIFNEVILNGSNITTTDPSLITSTVISSDAIGFSGNLKENSGIIAGTAIVTGGTVTGVGVITSARGELRASGNGVIGE